MSKKFMEICIGVFFLTLSTILIWAIIISKQAVDEAIVISKKQATKQEELMTSLNELIIIGKETISESMELAKQQVHKQEELMNLANLSSVITMESGYAVLARVLEQYGVMSSEESNMIVSAAIDQISSKSEKMGVIAHSLNKSYLEKQNKILSTKY